MAQMEFYYIGKWHRSKKLQTSTFKAYEYKDKETKEVTLYPIIASEYCQEPTEIFINGVGYKKIGKKTIEVPVFDGESEHWDEYLEKYGAYCLYYSIDGNEYGLRDCCQLAPQTEFKSILKYGVEGYMDFITHFNRMVSIQYETIRGKYATLLENVLRHGNNEDDQIRAYIFAPSYYMLYSFMTSRYAPDVIRDDEKMVHLYRDMRRYELQTKSEDYQKALALEKRKFKLSSVLREKYGVSFRYQLNDSKVDEYNKLVDDCDKLFSKAEEPITEQLRIETNTDNDIFPTSVKDRVKYLFGEEAARIYDYLVEIYLSK